MAFVTAQPEALSAAAETLSGIGVEISSQNTAIAAPTTGVLPAATDEVSMLTAAQFAAHGQLYQQVSARAIEVHEMFVRTLSISGISYGATEAANATGVA